MARHRCRSYDLLKTSLGIETDPVNGIQVDIEYWVIARDKLKETKPVARILHNVWQDLWNDEQGQDIAEYAVMLAVILVIVVGTVRLIGSNANNVFSQVGSSIQ